MRYLTRLNVLGSLAFIGILVALSLLYASGNFYTVGNRLNLSKGSSTILETSPDKTTPVEIPTIPSNADHRLVVFGDAWSATGSRLADQGRAWPEWFCTMWPCQLESYAQKQHACKSAFCGSVIDESELHTVDSDVSRTLEPLPDLRTQIDQWLASEILASKTYEKPGDLETSTNNTVFAVSFPLWDIWKFNGASPGETKDSTKRSISTMFEQLDRLADYTGSEHLRVIVMMSIDPTFLPAFDPAQGQKDMIAVVSQWNTELKEQAENWSSGSVYVYNTNDFLTNQIRSRQFFLAGMLDGHGLAEHNLWDDVENPCVQTTSNWLPFLSDKDERCENPDKFLFWDGLHLGPAANKIMSQQIFHDIDGLWIIKESNSSAT